MKIEMGKEYMTRCGSHARILCTDADSAIYPVVGTVHGKPHAWTLEGRSLSYEVCYDDLVEIPACIRRPVWLNIHQHGANAYYDKAEADEAASQRLACVRVDIDCEEGDGL